ncbi:MAG: hypothetical protein ACE5R6_07605 [Candidatus Heimdallarchaeota archaeon]
MRGRIGPRGLICPTARPAVAVRPLDAHPDTPLIGYPPVPIDRCVSGPV